MFLLLILPILVSGFLVCNIHPVYKYKLHRYEGQYLYLKSAALGIVCVMLASVVVLYLNQKAPHSIELFGQMIPLDVHSFINSLIFSTGSLDKSESAELAWVFIIIFSSFVVPYIWSILAYIKYCIRYFTLRPNESINGEILSDSPLDNFLFNASLKKGDHMVMLTLSDRKVYVGKVLNLGEPNESEGQDQEVTIKPVVSGNRDKDSLKVDFNTHYNGLGADTYLIIRQDLITSACEFSFETYDNLNPKKAVWVPMPHKKKK